jgi:uncharacterized protein (DUF1810 family)
MAAENNLQRFIDAQTSDYAIALAEIRKGKKRSHWMWYIFPQIRGLGHTETSKYYAIRDIAEAQSYFDHPVLGPRLTAIAQELLLLESSNANEIFGSPDDLKLKSSLTLFASIDHTDPVFQEVLDKFFNGVNDQKTLEIIHK